MTSTATRLSAVCAAAAVLAVSANASASYYGVLWNPNVPSGPADNGAIVSQFVNVLGSGCGDFVDHEMWYGWQGGIYWVEVGLTSGQTPQGCQGGVVFWADNRSNGGNYHEHYPGIQWYTQADYELAVTNAGSCTWDVYFAGNQGWQFIGLSTSNCFGSGRYLASGIETTSQASSQQVQGDTWGWEREDSSGNWQANWTSTAFRQFSPPFIHFTNSNDNVTEEVLNEPF